MVPPAMGTPVEPLLPSTLRFAAHCVRKDTHRFLLAPVPYFSGGGAVIHARAAVPALALCSGFGPAVAVFHPAAAGFAGLLPSHGHHPLRWHHHQTGLRAHHFR